MMLFYSGKIKSIVLNKKVLLREGSVLLISQLIFVSLRKPEPINQYTYH